MAIIGVIGGNECTPEIADQAEKMGALIALQGHLLVCGGGGGVMLAAAKGCVLAGGTTLGILPGTNKAEANPYISIPIVTGMGIGRNVIIARTADVLVAIDGKYGTLSEIAYGLQLGKPVIALNSWAIPGVQTFSSVEEAFRRIMEILNKSGSPENG
ncbi:MAG: TIGR00725 family protein [Calditrichia bacterium]